MFPPSNDRLQSLSLEGSEGSARDPKGQGKAIRMALYEHIFLARQDVTQQQVETLTER